MLEIKVNSLFRKYNYNLKFENKVNVLIGENGCGKSTILRMINSMLKKDYVNLSEVSFKDISIKHNSNQEKIDLDKIISIKEAYANNFQYILNNIDPKIFDNFEDFYSCFQNKISSSKMYYVKNDEKGITELRGKFSSLEKYIAEIDCNDQVVQKVFAKRKTNYGSVEFLKNYYHYYRGNLSFFEESNVNVIYRTFVDEAINPIIDNIDFNCFDALFNKYFTDKQYSIDDGKLIIKDQDTNEIIPFEYMSSGEKKILELIVIFSSAQENDVLLLDEPDVSLSIYWQSTLIDDIQKYCKAEIIIIATQSSNLLTEEQLDLLVPIYVE